jgi:endonuclease/exonuclease/phosphatase family metal-dependent hydrolase
VDTDYDATTGKYFNGIGAELEIAFDGLDIRYFQGNNTYTTSWQTLQFYHQPTVGSNRFELAIARSAVVAGSLPLFSGDSIRLALRYGNSDLLPDAGQTLPYVFDNGVLSPAEPLPLEKTSPQHLRLLTWNTLSDGLDDLDRAPRFRRLLQVMVPDVVTFNECWDMTAGQVATFLNQALPLGNFQSWKAVKLDDGNVTASRYPILQSWYFYPGHRLTASLIDLPDEISARDLLVINAHLRCCTGGEYFRQLEADALAAFLLDARQPGGSVDLPDGTPFVISGDLNLVGWQQPLQTLQTGQIVHNNLFGAGGPLDWDGSELVDILSRHTDQRQTFTWRNPGSAFPPSRIDYHIASGSVLTVEHSFTLRTESMPADRLAFYGLSQDDTGQASDHLPKVTDFSFALSTATNPSYRPTGQTLRLAPNPFRHNAQLMVPVEAPSTAELSVYNLRGERMHRQTHSLAEDHPNIPVRLDGFPAGLYIFEVKTAGKVYRTTGILFQE